MNELQMSSLPGFSSLGIRPRIRSINVSHPHTMTPELVQLWLPKNDSLHGAVDNQEMMRDVLYCIPLVFSGRETIEISS